MSFRTTYILFGILIVELAVFGWLLSYKKTVDREDFLFPSLNLRASPVKIGDIDRVEVDVLRNRGGANEKLVFVRSGLQWHLESPSVRVEPQMVTAIIQSLISARKEENADVNNNLAQFGLDSPSGQVTLIKNEGDVRWVLKIGNESIGGANAFVYVTSSDRGEGKEVLAVRRDQFESFLKPAHEIPVEDQPKEPAPPVYKTLNDYRTKSLLGDSPIDLLAVDLREARHPRLAFAKDAKSGHWRFTEPAGYGEVEEAGAPPSAGSEKKGPAGIRDLLDAVIGLRVESNADFKDNHASDAELAERGLTTKKPETLRIGVERYAGGYLAPGSEDRNAKIDDALLIGKKADPKGDKYYARLENERYLVLVSGKKVQTLLDLLDRPEILRNRDLENIAQPSVDAIDIKQGDRTLKLRKGTGGWLLYEGGKASDADAEAVGGLLTVLGTKGIVKDFPKATSEAAGLNSPRAVVSLWASGLESRELKLDAEPKLREPEKPTVQLTFGKTFEAGKEKKEELVYVRRKTELDETLVAVPTRMEKGGSILETVLRGRVAYLNATLPQFHPDRVLKLIRVLREDGKESLYELEPKEKKADQTQPGWFIRQPANWAGRRASPYGVEGQTLHTLRVLRPARLVAEKVTEADLKKTPRWGLDKPAIQVTLQLRVGEKGTEDWIYQFGNKVEQAEDKLKEGDGVYGRLKAKEEDRGLVFVVRAADIKDLKADLRDPTILRFDPTQADLLRLTGWQKDGKPPVTLEYQRDKDGRWSGKGGAKSQKVADFVRSLVDLQATQFVAGAPTKEDYQLDPRAGSLKLELRVAGKVLSLTIGGPGDGGTYYATSDQLPAGQVFLVRQGLFHGLRQGPEYFSK